MVVLHIYGKISPICISKKLGLFISNLTEEENSNWKEDLEQELLYMEAIDGLHRSRLGVPANSQIAELYEKISSVSGKSISVSEMAHTIADKMICMYFRYEYDDMPLGGWETNCFDGRFCEEDYAEKIIDLMTFYLIRRMVFLFLLLPNGYIHPIMTKSITAGCSGEEMKQQSI